MSIPQHILDNLPEMVLLTDANKKLIYANPSAYRYFQLKENSETLLNKHLRIRSVELSWEQIYEQLQQKKSLRALFIHKTPQRQNFLEIHFTALENGQTLSTTREITQQKQRETHWTKEKLKHDALNTLISDGYILVGRNYSLVEMNPRAKELINFFSQQEFAEGKDIRNLDLPDLPVYIEAFQQALHGKQVDLQQKIQRKNKQPATIDFAFAPVFNERQKIWAVMVMFRDVSTVYDLEQNVKNIQKRFDNLGKVLPGCLYEYDVDLKTKQHWFNYLSEGAATLLGFSAEEVINKPESILSCVDSEELPKVQESILEAATQGKIWEATFPFQNPEKGQRWIYGRSSPQIQGEHMLFSGVLLDVTEAEQARQKLRQQEFKNKAILAALPDDIFEIHINGDVREIQTGKKSEKKQFPHYLLQENKLPEPIQLQLKNGISQALKTKKTCHLSIEYQTSPEIWEHYDVRMMAASHDKVFCMVRDLSELRLLTRQLQHSEQNLLAMLENSGDDSIWFVAPDFCLIKANQMCLQSVSAFYDAPLKIGDHIIEYMRKKTPEEASVWRGYYNKAFAGERVRREYGVTDKTGQSYYIEADFNPVFSDGKVIGCVCIASDITAYKKAEQSLTEMNQKLETRVQERTAELQASKEQAEAANMAKTGFLANISHEVRTPIHAVIGYTNMLEAALKENLKPSQAHNYIQSIRNGAQTLLTLINDLLDLSQLESGGMKSQPEAISLLDLCSELLNMFQPRAHEKLIQIKLFMSPEVPPFVMLDPVRTRQILLNLLGNAVKFTHEGYVHLNVRVDHEKIVFCVEDSGIGISTSSLDKIFAPFTQQDGQLARDYGGTGLGLAITQRLLNMMGGTINVTSKTGQGSSFCVELPLEIAPHHTVGYTPQIKKPETPKLSVQLPLQLQLSHSQQMSLEKTFEEDYLQTFESYSFDRTSAFAKRLRSWSIVYNHKSLIQFSEALFAAANCFDIESMTKLLSEYARWIESNRS